MMRRGAVTALALALSATLSGCMSAGATTCADFGAMGYEERDETLQDLLREHRLEPMDAGNTIGVQAAVDAYCGTTTSQLLDQGPASRNMTQPIEDSVDWDSGYW
jgi:hypothetical protein